MATFQGKDQLISLASTFLPSQVAVAVGFLMIQNTRPVMLAGRAFGGGKQGVTNLTAL